MAQILIAVILAGLYIGAGVLLLLPKCPIDFSRARYLFGAIYVLGGVAFLYMAFDLARDLLKSTG